MMAILQNAIANTSSTLIIAKVQGNIIDTLMPPLSAFEVLIGFGLKVPGHARPASRPMVTLIAMLFFGDLRRLCTCGPCCSSASPDP